MMTYYSMFHFRKAFEFFEHLMKRRFIASRLKMVYGCGIGSIKVKSQTYLATEGGEQIINLDGEFLQI